MYIDCNLDMQLVRALKEGAAALPRDLERLRSYMLLINALLKEKAGDLEPSWEACCEAASEIETLQALERNVAERAIVTKADTLSGVRAKIAIWKVLSVEVDEDMDGPRSQLILSVEDDLRRLAVRAGSDEFFRAGGGPRDERRA